jgi:hypothetical protein
MPKHALPHLAPGSVGVEDDRIDGYCLCGPVLPPGQVLPDDSKPRPDLNNIKARLEAATADLGRLRARLLNALNKGVVLNEMGEIVDRLDALCRLIPDTPSPPQSQQRGSEALPSSRTAVRHHP